MHPSCSRGIASHEVPVLTFCTKASKHRAVCIVYLGTWRHGTVRTAFPQKGAALTHGGPDSTLMLIRLRQDKFTPLGQELGHATSRLAK